MAEKKLETQPERTYEIPGGPYAKDLGTLNVYRLADFKRGSADDRGIGNKR